jgi:uncharacterized protein (TIGR03437 family)
MRFPVFVILFLCVVCLSFGLLGAHGPGVAAQSGKFDSRIWQKLEPAVPAVGALSLQQPVAAPEAQTLELRLDDGSVEDVIQQDGWLVLNRVTPPAYPATLQKLRIMFAALQNQPSPVGKPITLVVYADPSGTGQLPANPPLTRINATVPGVSLTNFFDFTLANAPTIQSGDFYIGYQLATPHQGVSFLFDTNNGNAQAQNRTFISQDNGANFAALPPPTGGLSAIAMVRGEVRLPNAPDGPTLDVAPSLNFGTINVNGTADRSLTIRNTGTAALSVSGITSSNPAFTVLPPGPPFTIAAGGQQQVSVRFTAAAQGVQNGALTITSDDPTRPSLTVALTGSAVVVTTTVVPLTSGTPQTGTIGGSTTSGCVLGSTQYSIVVPAGGSALQISLSGNQDVDLYVRFNSAVALQNNQLVADFRSQSLSNSESVTITPATLPALQPGTYYIGVGNCSSFTANYTVTATVSVGTAGQISEELNVDDGSPESGVSGNGFIFVNRLTPSRYPSRLQRIRVFFAQFQNQPDPSGAQIRLLAFNAPANTPPPTSPSYLVDRNVTIPTLTTPRYVDFDIPENPSITEGDWYIGFQMPNPANGVACVVDLTSTAQGRSLFRGPTATPFQNLTGANSMIRAVVLSGTQPVCNYAIAPTSQSFTASGGAGNVNVTVNAGCNWTAVSNVNWLTITSGGSGSGNGTVNFSAAAHTTPASRTGTLTIAGQTFTVTQAGVPCTYSIAPPSQSFAASGGNGTVAVTAANGCAWMAASNAPWLSITAGAAGDGNGTVAFTVAANPNQSERTGTLTVAGQTFTVTQAAFVCSYAIAPASQSFTASGGTGNVNVTAASGCAWLATSNAAWVTITSGASGNGNGTVAFSVTANPNQSERTGTLTIAGQTFTVTQAAFVCSYTLAPTSQNVAAGGGTGSLNVTAASGCNWTATSSADWLMITSGASGSGNGTVGFSATANPTAAQRSGTLTIAGQTFTVTQAGQPCTYTIAPTSQSFAVGGGTGTVNVTALAGCNWTATSNANWLTITSGGSGSGNGSVAFSVAANTSPMPRTGTLTIAGQTFTVTQAEQCAYSIAPTSQPFEASGGTGSVNVATTSACSWTATSNANWLTITSGASGSGNGAVSYSVAANPNITARTGTLTVAGQTFTVTQAALVCNYVIAPTSQSVSAEASTGSLNVTVNSGCAWTATSNASWLTITNGATGSGNGTVNYSVAANPSVSARTGTLTVAGQTFTVTQSGAVTNRLVRIAPAIGVAGGKVRVPVELVAQGNENAVAFTLTFDPNVLSNPQPELPTVSGQVLTSNPAQVAQGRLGLMLALRGGASFEAGARLVAAVNFDIAANATGQPALGFGDQPVERKITDAAGNLLPCNYTGGTVMLVSPVASVSAASFSAAALAPGSMLAAFGTKLATRTELATTLPLPTSLAGTRVNVRDSFGNERLAPLFFVAPGQVNYLLPVETASGTATITVISGDGTLSLGTVNVALVAPSLFTANSNGQGVAAGVVLRVKADGSQVYEPLAVFDNAQQRFVPAPIDLGPANEQVFAIFFGTGLRNVGRLADVSVQLGGRDAAVLFAGPQGDLAGLDQLNVQLSRELSGRGELEVMLTAAGRSANVVRIAVK